MDSYLPLDGLFRRGNWATLVTRPVESLMLVLRPTLPQGHLLLADVWKPVIRLVRDASGNSRDRQTLIFLRAFGSRNEAGAPRGDTR